MTDNVDREFKRLLPKLRQIERSARDAGLTSSEQAALMTMLAARLMGTAGAMMAAHHDATTGRSLYLLKVTSDGLSDHPEQVGQRRRGVFLLAPTKTLRRQSAHVLAWADVSGR